MTTTETLEWIVAIHARIIRDDLVQFCTQDKYTTKNGRRERSLIYVLENLTGSIMFSPSDTMVKAFAEAVNDLRTKAKSQEAIVAIDRIQKRLDYLISNPLRQEKCVACGEVIDRDGVPHECTNKTARMKDVAMQRDDTVMITREDV